MWAGAGDMGEVARSEGARERGSEERGGGIHLLRGCLCNIFAILQLPWLEWRGNGPLRQFLTIPVQNSIRLPPPPYYQRAPAKRLYNSCRTLVITAETGTVAPTVRQQVEL